ncbi:MAG: flotillin-like FloA family protein [Phycisphaerales bacterium]
MHDVCRVMLVARCSSCVLAHQNGRSATALLIVVGAAWAVIMIALFGVPFVKWLRFSRRVPGVGFWQVLGMSVRKVPLGEVADAMEILQRCGASVDLSTVETYWLAGGRVVQMARAYEVLHRARLNPSWEMIAALDLAGKNVLFLAESAVTPHVVEAPLDERQPWFVIPTRDGTKLAFRLRVHTLTNMNAVIGGLQETDVVQACAEKVIEMVSNADSALSVAERPEAFLQGFEAPVAKIAQACTVVKVELVGVGVV